MYSMFIRNLNGSCFNTKKLFKIRFRTAAEQNLQSKFCEQLLLFRINFTKSKLCQLEIV